MKSIRKVSRRWAIINFTLPILLVSWSVVTHVAIAGEARVERSFRDRERDARRRANLLNERERRRREIPSGKAIRRHDVNPEAFERRANLMRRVQHGLIKKGYDPGPTDGLWGTRTSEAVRKFQQDNALNPNGRLDRKTLTTLLGLP